MAEAEERIIARLEALGDEAPAAILRGDFGDSATHPVRRVANAWLADRDSVNRSAREERTLSIAKEANSIARRAERWAMYAAIIAAAAAVYTAKDTISALVISWLP